MAIMLSVAITSRAFNLNVIAQNVQTEQSVSGGDVEGSNEANSWEGGNREHKSWQIFGSSI